MLNVHEKQDKSVLEHSCVLYWVMQTDMYSWLLLQSVQADLPQELGMEQVTLNEL